MKESGKDIEWELLLQHWRGEFEGVDSYLATTDVGEFVAGAFFKGQPFYISRAAHAASLFLCRKLILGSFSEIDDFLERITAVAGSIQELEGPRRNVIGIVFETLARYSEKHGPRQEWQTNLHALEKILAKSTKGDRA